MINEKGGSKRLIGACKCSKCGKLVKVNTDYYVCLTSCPPQYAYCYGCPECGYSGRIYADDVKLYLRRIFQ